MTNRAKLRASRMVIKSLIADPCVKTFPFSRRWTEPTGRIQRRFQTSPKRLRQQGHSPSYPLTSAAKADGCGIVMIALNAKGAR